MANLNQAVQLIRQGHKDEARRLLEPILKTNPHDIQAWFWLTETCTSQEQRLKVLEICLKINPGHPQVLRVVQALRSGSVSGQVAASSTEDIPEWAKRSSASSSSVSTLPAEPPFSVSAESAAAAGAPISAEEKSSTPVSGWDVQEQPTELVSVAAETNYQKQEGALKPAFDWEALEAQYPPPVAVAPHSAPLQQSEEQTRSAGLPFYRVWWRALSTQTVQGYAEIFDDPEAGAGRALEWIIYTGLVSGLSTPLWLMLNPDLQDLLTSQALPSLLSRMNETALLVLLGLVMAVLMPLLSAISLFLGAGIYHILAVFFGGNGTFGRTIYAQAAYWAPLSLISTLLGLIPTLGSCLTVPIGLYAIVLNLRALMAAHHLSFVRALGVLLLPGLLVFISSCLLVFLVLPRFL
ncbi:MAG: hypothetical protein DDG60_12370 [Anaerolineae bacterium]|nr:MAG: hypothetical protein DDG60_12370 [Anaerolineae bacterium]